MKAVKSAATRCKTMAEVYLHGGQAVGTPGAPDHNLVPWNETKAPNTEAQYQRLAASTSHQQRFFEDTTPSADVVDNDRTANLRQTAEIRLPCVPETEVSSRRAK